MALSPAILQRLSSLMAASRMARPVSRNTMQGNTSFNPLQYLKPSYFNLAKNLYNAPAALLGSTSATTAAPASTWGAQMAAQGAMPSMAPMNAGTFLGPFAAGFGAPNLINSLHKDSTENLGHNLTFGLVKNEKASNQLGGAATGALAGTAILPGIGTVLGGFGGLIAGSLFGKDKPPSPWTMRYRALSNLPANQIASLAKRNDEWGESARGALQQWGGAKSNAEYLDLAREAGRKGMNIPTYNLYKQGLYDPQQEVLNWQGGT